jgi:hypothetical protein
MWIIIGVVDGVAVLGLVGYGLRPSRSGSRRDTSTWATRLGLTHTRGTSRLFRLSARRATVGQIAVTGAGLLCDQALCARLTDLICDVVERLNPAAYQVDRNAPGK